MARPATWSDPAESIDRFFESSGAQHEPSTHAGIALPQAMRTGHVYANHFPGRSLTDQSSVCASYLLGLDVHYRGQSLPPKGYVRPIKGEYPLLAPKRTFEFRRSMSPVRCKRSFNLTANPKVTRLRHACQGGRVNWAVITHAGRKKTPPWRRGLYFASWRNVRRRARPSVNVPCQSRSARRA